MTQDRSIRAVSVLICSVSVASLIASPLAPARALPALYECLDSAGAQVLTDSPTQLDHCVEVSDDPPGSSAPPGPSQSLYGAGVQPPSRADETPATPRTLDSAMPPVVVPVQRMGDLLVVSTHVNRAREARLILDTGASHTIFSHDLANDLGLLIKPAIGSVILKTAGGPVQAEMVQVDSIRVGDAEVRGSVAAVCALPDIPQGIDGLLGLSFLSRFSVTVDTANNQLHLRK